MADLVQWLTACLDEDERIAREAPSAIGSAGHSDGAWADPQARWVADHHLVMRRPLTGDEEVRIVADCAAFGGPPAAVHIAAHDPARVLREVDAKRRIVEIHRVVGGFEDEDMTDLGSGCSECGYPAEYGDRGGWCETLRLLALPYEDRPSYQEAWRP